MLGSQERPEVHSKRGRMQSKKRLNDLKAFVSQIDQKLEALASSGREAGDHTRVQAHLFLMELADKWEQMQEELNKEAQKIRRSAEKTKGVIDSARLKTHLAKADARDELAEIKQSVAGIQKRLTGFISEQKGQAFDANERLRQYFKKFAEDLGMK